MAASAAKTSGIADPAWALAVATGLRLDRQAAFVQQDRPS